LDSIPADQQSVIVCGVVQADGSRLYIEKEHPYFNTNVDVYTAEDDPQQRTLYRASALAHKFQVATNQVGMYLVRRRHVEYVQGLFQASSFLCKPRGSSGLKAGGYFVSMELCKEFEEYMIQHSKHVRHRNRAALRKDGRREPMMHRSPAAAAAAAPGKGAAGAPSSTAVHKAAAASKAAQASSALMARSDQSLLASYSELQSRLTRKRKLESALDKLQLEKNLAGKGRRSKVVTRDEKFGDIDETKTVYKWKMERKK